VNTHVSKCKNDKIKKRKVNLEIKVYLNTVTQYLDLIAILNFRALTNILALALKFKSSLSSSEILTTYS
jgi:hypothetical protein